MYINSLMSVLRMHVLGYFIEKWLDFMKNITCGLDRIFVWFVPLEKTVFFSFSCGAEITWGCICDTNFCRTVFLFLNTRNIIGFVFNKN